MTSNISNGPWRPTAGLDGEARANGGDAMMDEKKLRSSSDVDEEDEDMDALIEELESEDPEPAVVEEDFTSPTAGRVVPEELLNTDTRVGLEEWDVIARRKKFGLNQMKEEKENLILKFLMYFVGPIQFVMEVSCRFSLRLLVSFERNNKNLYLQKPFRG